MIFFFSNVPLDLTLYLPHTSCDVRVKEKKNTPNHKQIHVLDLCRDEVVQNIGLVGNRHICDVNMNYVYY